jgi:hypothetical protein
MLRLFLRSRHVSRFDRLTPFLSACPFCQTKMLVSFGDELILLISEEQCPQLQRSQVHEKSSHLSPHYMPAAFHGSAAGTTITSAP